MELPLLEKKKYTIEELYTNISGQGTIFLQDLLETETDGHLFTLFMNHTLVVKDVEELSFVAYDDKKFIHGIIDVYDRVLREKTFNAGVPETGPKIIENDHLADIVIRSNLIINVLELNVSNFIQNAPGKSVALQNKYLIELYTDWHTQLHYKENEFAKLFFE